MIEAPLTTVAEKGELISMTVAASESHEEGGNPFLKLDPGVGIWSIAVFLILLFLLKRFAWGPIISSIEEREKSIRDSLDKAKDAQNESKRIAMEQNEILSAAKKEASSIIQNAKSAAEELGNKIKHEAQEEKKRIVEAGVREIQSAKSAAVSELKVLSADLAIEIAEKLVEKTMDDKANRDYVDKLIGEIDTKTS